MLHCTVKLRETKHNTGLLKKNLNMRKYTMPTLLNFYYSTNLMMMVSFSNTQVLKWKESLTETHIDLPSSY